MITVDSAQVRQEKKRNDQTGQALMIQMFLCILLKMVYIERLGNLNSQLLKRTRNCSMMVNVDQVLTMLNIQMELQFSHLVLDLTQA